VASVTSQLTGVAEEARTRGFAAPAFAGCAFVEDSRVVSYRPVRGLSSRWKHRANERQKSPVSPV